MSKLTLIVFNLIVTQESLDTYINSKTFLDFHNLHTVVRVGPILNSELPDFIIKRIKASHSFGDISFYSSICMFLLFIFLLLRF